MSDQNNAAAPQTPVNPEPPKTQVPFHEDPKIQEYIARQVKKGVEEGIKSLVPPPAKKTLPSAPNDPYHEIANSLSQELDIDPEYAKKFVDKIVKVNELATKGIRDTLEANQIAQRFATVISNYENGIEMEPEMQKTFKELDESTQRWILSSQQGAEYLFNLAYQKKYGGTATPAQRAAAGTGRGTSASSANRTISTSQAQEEARKAFASGDKTAYEKAIQKLRTS